MDVKCIKKTIDFLFPINNRLYDMRCTPLLLVKSTFPSRIKKNKITPEWKGLDTTQEYSFACSLVKFENWLASRIEVAHCLFDVADFSSCQNTNSRLPIKHTRTCGKKDHAPTILLTPARILANKHLEILDLSSCKKLKSDDYRAIIYEWLK